MRIVDVRTVLLTGPSTNDPYLGRTRRSAAFIEILTDTELTGLARRTPATSSPRRSPPIVDFYRPILAGPGRRRRADPGRPALPHRALLGRTGLGLAVMTGIEAALWDLRGRELGQPVHELLGGKRHDSLLGYATGAGTGLPEASPGRQDRLLPRPRVPGVQDRDRRLDAGRRGVRLHRAG